MDAATIKVTMSRNGEVATLIVGETLTIENCAEFKQALADTLNAARQVVLDACRLRQVDITSLQLLCSACRSASSKGKVLAFENEIPDCVKSLRSSAGADRSCHCIRTESCKLDGGNK